MRSRAVAGDLGLEVGYLLVDRPGSLERDCRALTPVKVHPLAERARVDDDQQCLDRCFTRGQAEVLRLLPVEVDLRHVQDDGLDATDPGLLVTCERCCVRRGLFDKVGRCGPSRPEGQGP